jgi:hypothetical protein
MHHRFYCLLILGMFLAGTSVQAQSRGTAPTVHKGIMVLEGNPIQAVGEANYTIESKGRLVVKGTADAPPLQMKGLKFDRSFEVAPANLQSARYQKVGATVPFDGFNLEVIAVDRGRKLSTARGKNSKGEVVFVFDTSRTMIDLQRISLTSQTLPVPLHLRRAR